MNQQTDHEVIATLNELIETSLDGEKGFALAASDSKDADLTNVFRQGEQSCRVAAAQLQDQVRTLGGNPEDGGSMKAAVHRGWISLKSAASVRDSKAILEECATRRGLREGQVRRGAAAGSATACSRARRAAVSGRRREPRSGSGSAQPVSVLTRAIQYGVTHAER